MSSQLAYDDPPWDLMEAPEENIRAVVASRLVKYNVRVRRVRVRSRAFWRMSARVAGNPAIAKLMFGAILLYTGAGTVRVKIDETAPEDGAIFG